MATANRHASTKPLTTRVLLVDDHPFVREGVAHRLNAEPDLTVCGEADSAATGLAAAAKLRPDVVVADLSLEGRGGLELIKDLKTQYPKLPVLVLSMHDEALYAERALHAGASGYVMKQEPPETLVQAIRKVRAGKVHVSPRMTERLLHDVTAGVERSQSPWERLTDRELEILEQIGKGRTTRQIAEALHISVKTVATHRENIKAKLQVGHSAELVLQAVEWARRSEGRPASKP